MSTKFWFGLIAITTLAMIGSVSLVFIIDKELKPTLRITQKSNINTLEAVFRTRFRIDQVGKPDIVWQNPKTGISESEDVLFQLMNVRNKKEAEHARQVMRKEGLRRVYEMCRGTTRKDFRWSYGYCTYEDAPELPEG